MAICGFHKEKTMNHRFFEKIAIKPGDSCWEWQGARLKAGYGQAFVKGKLMLAHRAMYEHTVGPIPEGMVVMHTCDNPPCCNPNHLRLGTARENVHDCKAKGRARYVGMSGESNPNVALSAAQVDEIRSLYKGPQNRMRPRTGPTLTELAKQFKVGTSQIKRIVDCESWGQP
jgi:hypothetical protein